MYNQNQEHHKSSAAPPPMSPRISFSNDFVESSQYSHNSHSTLSQFKANPSAYRDAPVSSDFEFSVNNYSMMSADELFSKGRLLPFKESIIKNNNNTSSKTTTLRDELQNGDDNFSLRPPKNPTRWRGFLGLRKSHIGSKKIDKGEGSRQAFPHDDNNKNPQDSVND